MSGRKRAVLLLVVAALSVTGILAACRATNPATGTPPATAETPPAEQQVSPGDVDTALNAIAWPEGPEVARVNGVQIKTEVWREEVVRQLRLVTSQYQVDWNDRANLDQLPMVLDRTIDHMADMELLRQLAAKEQITVLDADVQQEIEASKQQLLAGGQYEDLDAFLQANQLTQSKFEELIRERVLVDRLLAAHGGPSRIEQVRARHILVADEEVAKEVLTKLAAEESFEELAKAYSIDTGSKEQGGDLGWFPRGWMVPEFDEGAFALQPGETSAAVESRFGFHIIRVEERATRELEEPMLSQMREENFVEWLDAERKLAKIERLYTASLVSAPQP